MSIFNTFYDHGILPKYTLAFGTLFKDMQLIRKNPDGSEFERYVVPISYSPKEKYIQRIKSDPDLLRKEGFTYPRMAFEMVSISYDSSRNLNNKQLMGLFNTTNGNTKTAMFSPSPFNMVFELYITTKTISEMLQIVEQILPAFRPDYNIAVKLFSNPVLTLDVPITLMSEMGQDSYEGDIDEQRTIMWTLQFLVKGYLFGPIKNAPIIKQVIFTEHSMSQKDADDIDLITLSTMTSTVVVAGKTLEEIYGTDNWSIETIFS